MKIRFASRIALSTLLAFAAVLPLQAQTPAPAAPTVTFQLANDTTIHQSAGPVQVAVQFADNAGLKIGTISGGYSSATLFYTGGPKSASAKLWFYASYFAVGDYVFQATAYDINGIKTTSQITLHLVP
jgi:hypothetical protein